MTVEKDEFRWKFEADAARKRRKPSSKILSRRRQVAALITRGVKQYLIADKLKVSQTTICNDVKSIEAMWMAGMMRPRSAIKSAELAKLDAMDEDAAMSFARSKGEKGNKSGDPKWLRIRLDIMKRRAELLGLDEPIEINLAMLDRDVRQMTDEQLEEAERVLMQIDEHGLVLH